MWLFITAAYVSKVCGMGCNHDIVTAFTYRRVLRDYGMSPEETRPPFTVDGMITVKDVVRCLMEPSTYITYVLLMLVKTRCDFFAVQNCLEEVVEEHINVFPLSLLRGHKTSWKRSVVLILIFSKIIFLFM